MIINTTTARTFLEAMHGINNTLDLIQALQGLSRQLDEKALNGLAEAITGRNIEALDIELDELKEQFDEYKADIDHKIDGLNDLCALFDKLSRDEIGEGLLFIQNKFK